MRFVLETNTCEAACRRTHFATEKNTLGQLVENAPSNFSHTQTARYQKLLNWTYDEMIAIVTASSKPGEILITLRRQRCSTIFRMSAMSGPIKNCLYYPGIMLDALKDLHVRYYGQNYASLKFASLARTRPNLIIIICNMRSHARISLSGLLCEVRVQMWSKWIEISWKQCTFNLDPIQLHCWQALMENSFTIANCFMCFLLTLWMRSLHCARTFLELHAKWFNYIQTRLPSNWLTMLHLICNVSHRL